MAVCVAVQLTGRPELELELEVLLVLVVVVVLEAGASLILARCQLE